MTASRICSSLIYFVVYFRKQRRPLVAAKKAQKKTPKKTPKKAISLKDQELIIEEVRISFSCLNIIQNSIIINTRWFCRKMTKTVQKLGGGGVGVR